MNVVTGLFWRLTVARLRRCVPVARCDAVLGDLQEDYARRLQALGTLRAGFWLLREARSLERAYRRRASERRETSPGAWGWGPTRLENDDATPRHGALSILANDTWHAWRRVVARPASALLCAALLALGIGLSTAMFSVVDSLLFRPAPFLHGDRLVTQGLPRSEPRVMDAWRASGMFDGVEASRTTTFRAEVSASGTWPGALVTPGVFELLGVRPSRGRLFGPDDAIAGGGDRVLLSETVWRSAFGADPSLVGRRITLDNVALVVVGILPARVRFPTPATVVWRPLDPVTDVAPIAAATSIIGRLKPGVPRADAETRVNTIALELARLPRAWSKTHAPPLTAVGGPELSVFIRRALWLLLAGVGLVFVVLCANVSSLLLTHLATRRREFGMCTALGASRGRLLRQATIEHALIAIIGAGAGVGLAWGLTTIVPDVFLGRTLNVIDVDLRALAIASALGIASVFMAGLLPAWLGTRTDPLQAIRSSRQVGGETRATRAAARGFLVAEVAMACALLVGSTLLVRSFVNLVNADRGLDLDGVVQIDFAGLDNAYPSQAAMGLGTAAIEAAIARWPEVREVALSRELPPSWYETSVDTDRARADRYRVNSDFFDFYAIPIVRGRPFDTNDAAGETVVGERLASILWPGGDPLGRLVDLGNAGQRRVVGVAAEIRLPTLDAASDRPEFYVPMGDRARTLFASVRCHGECPNEATIRARVSDVHPAISARRRTTSDDPYVTQLRLPQAIAQVGGVFAIVAIVTAAGGLFSVMTHAVGRRRREFGIRTALGASPGQLRRVVLRDGLATVAVGIAIGIGGGWAVARSLAAFHYGVTAIDPISWIAVLATIGVTSLAATWRPAREAMRVDPVQLLRED